MTGSSVMTIQASSLDGAQRREPATLPHISALGHVPNVLLYDADTLVQPTV